MDVTADLSTFPVDLEGSLDPGQLPEFTFRSDAHMANHDRGSPSHMVNKSNSGRLSPVRGRTIKEYDKQISDLKKENFSLKIRIFHMEERMQQRYGDGQDVYKTNVELQVQVEKLKKDIADKQDLIQKAGVAMETLRANHEKEEENMKARILSEFKDEICQLQAHLEDANKECELYRKESEDAEEKIKALQLDLSKVKEDLCKSKQENSDLEEKLKNAEFDVQHLTAQFKLADQAKLEQEKENTNLLQHIKDLNDKLQNSHKEVSRKERDLQNLSALLQDQSHVDCTSILEPVHKQDEMEDALDTIKRKDDKLDVLENQLKEKDSTVGNLEDALKEMENKLKENEAEKKKLETELEKLRNSFGKYKKSYDQHIKTILLKGTELKNSEEKLNNAMDKITSLQEALQESEQEKAKTLGDLTKELTELDIDNRRLKVQLSESEGIAENLAMSLGKKEGELAGFQDQLKRAMDALKSSDEAVEALHEQLKAERAEFDKKLKEQALRNEVNSDRNTGLSNENGQLSDFEKMEALRQSREVSALAKELEDLKAQVHDKDLKIQTLEYDRVWIERHQDRIMHHATDKNMDDNKLPLDLLTDLKMLLEQLRKEMISLNNLPQLLTGMHKLGDTASTAELLLTEISSVQRIYKQLEGGVEKNSQIHQALLDSLRGERRQSDSPDSGSCQDGGHNLGHSDQQYKIPVSSTPDRQQQQLSSGSSGSSGKSAGLESSPTQVDRSFQTGTALSHSDQWVQTSPGPVETVDVGTSVTNVSVALEKTHLKGILNTYQSQDERSQLCDFPAPSPSNSNAAGVHPGRQSHVHFADNANDIRHASLTDDAKGTHPLSAANLDHVDFCNFDPGVLFDEDDFDLRAHDRASSARFDSRGAGSLSQNNSESAAVPSSTDSVAPTSSACNNIDSGSTQTPEKKAYNFPGLHLSPRFRGKSLPVVFNGYSQSQAQSVGNTSIGEIIDFNNHRSPSFLSSGGKIGHLNRSPASQRREKLMKDKQAIEQGQSEILETASEKGPEDLADQRSRRNSWAEELEQYKVHDQNRGSEQQSNSSNPQKQKVENQSDSQPQHQVIANMSAVELRDLVAQLQVDLVDAVKENKALQQELKAMPKRAPITNGHSNTRSGVPTKSKIPRLNASSSCHSTSDDSDHINTIPSQDSAKELSHDLPFNQNKQDDKVSKTARNRTVSADQATTITLQRKLNESHALIKNLQNKLEATENTVRLLSKKNKNYVSALESAGISAMILNRSNSESCLTSFTEGSNEKAASLVNLNKTDSSRRLAYLLSPFKEREMSTRENIRAMEVSNSSFSGEPHMLHGSPPSALVRSPTSTTTTSPSRNADISASSSVYSVQQTQSNINAASQPLRGTDISEPGTYFKMPAVPPPSSSKLTTAVSDPLSKNDNRYGHSVKAQQKGEEVELLPNQNFSKSRNDIDSQSPPSQSRNQTMGHSGFDASMMDTSAYPDVTYTSMLDGTLLHKLNHMTNLDYSLSATFTEEISSMSMEQLQGRLEHMERVNLTLREEISVYEAIHHSQGTQVSPSFCSQDVSLSTNNGQSQSRSDQDLLRQHLEEIRKLRQRLERLDITKDPDQLLIFQSHTQQRIARQETMLAHLQQQIVEKEEQHLRECTQLQHRLAREKAVLVEQLEQTIADLRKQLVGQEQDMQKREQQIQELKLQLQESEEREMKQNEETRKAISEKSELEDDLVKRDKEFLEMEKMMFRLEMAKENADSERKRMESDLVAKEKDCKMLKKEMADCKENLKCVKEIVVKREKSLQEKVHNLQKLTNEKSALETYVKEKENQVKIIENELNNLKREMHESQKVHNTMKEQLQSEIEELKSDRRKIENLEAKNAFQKAGYEAEIKRLNEEKMQMKSAHEREFDKERMDVRRQIEDLKNQVKDKQSLENELEMLRDKVEIISELQYKIEKLEKELDFKASEEAELQEKVDCLSHVQAEAKLLRDSLERSEDCLKSVEMEKTKIIQDLKEREEKLKKRDKQLKNLISQHMKLETTFSKQKNMLKEKTDLIHSQKKQLRLFEVSLTCSSQEEKDDIMKQLLKELIATQRQVEELLSRLEQNPINQPTVRVETYGMGNTASSAGVTTTVTTNSGAGSSASSGQDNVDTMLSVGVREGSPERCLGSMSPCLSEAELEVQPSSLVGSHTVTSSTIHSSPLRPVSTNLSSVPSLYSLSPRQLRYYADTDSELTSGKLPQSMVGSDIRSLFAVLKLESHEKLRKESSESLVILSTLEARLEDRLRVYKAMSVSESMDYSTLREASMSCRNLRLCLEEAVKLAASAWITELPPVDARGHFYDPILAEQ
ncbi:Cdk5 regulatory subunit associated protein 2, partial [Plakobranchus ocellatus]